MKIFKIKADIFGFFSYVNSSLWSYLTSLTKSIKLWRIGGGFWYCIRLGLYSSTGETHLICKKRSLHLANNKRIKLEKTTVQWLVLTTKMVRKTKFKIYTVFTKIISRFFQIDTMNIWQSYNSYSEVMHWVLVVLKKKNVILRTLLR